MPKSLAIPLLVALALTGCAATTLPDAPAPALGMGVPAIERIERPTILYVGNPQEVVGEEKPETVLDGWS